MDRNKPVLETESGIGPGVSPFFRRLALVEDPNNDPIAAQFVPRPEEDLVLDYESPDPISDRVYLHGSRLVHHYRDRALLLVTDKCATYCRHCFRRHFTSHKAGLISLPELDEVCAYLVSHPEIQEILLSGGDPLVASDSAIERILTALRAARPGLIIRVSTRMPIMNPERMTPELLNILSPVPQSDDVEPSPVWLILHCNHVRELAPEVSAALARTVDAGIPILAQTVLLRGVNDSVEDLEALFRGLLRRRVKPYYLFQGDLAAGTAHFRVPLSRGIELYRELRTRLSGMGMPTYAVDLPGAGGKVPIASPWYQGLKDGWHRFVNMEGKEFLYPEE